MENIFGSKGIMAHVSIVCFSHALSKTNQIFQQKILEELTWIILLLLCVILMLCYTN